MLCYLSRSNRRSLRRGGSRSVGGSSSVDFARQLAERNGILKPSDTKKFRSSAAPKGTKLGSGYIDRTQLRKSAEEDDKAVRVQALEEMVRLGQMERATFEALRDEIVGGDLKNVHLVKGLDRKLLERARGGEDMLANIGEELKPQKDEASPTKETAPREEADVDEEFEQIEGKELQPLAKEQKEKKGVMAPPPAVAGKKRNRDEILKELKASRQAIQNKSSVLGSRFQKIGERKGGRRIERDSKGREVLITMDAEGNVKRKIRKPDREDSSFESQGLLMPDKNAKPLGMDVAGVARPTASLDEDEGDIFEGVGADYDPLGGDDDEDDDSSQASGNEGKIREGRKSSPDTEMGEKAPPTINTSPDHIDEDPSIPPPPKPQIKSSKGPRNYFDTQNESLAGLSDSTSTADPLRDPTILAALKKASSIDPLSTESSSATEEEAAKRARRMRMLDSHDRDADDMDLGFGSSRFGDEEEGDEGKVKLSAWRTEGAEGESEEKGKSKRKRGPKKRKGDKDSAADVLKVLERRKNGGK